MADKDVVYQLVADLVCDSSKATEGLIKFGGVLDSLERKLRGFQGALTSAFRLNGVQANINKLNKSLGKVTEAKINSKPLSGYAAWERSISQKQNSPSSLLVGDAKSFGRQGLKGWLKQDEQNLNTAIERRARGASALNAFTDSIEQALNPQLQKSSYSTDHMKSYKNEKSMYANANFTAEQAKIKQVNKNTEDSIKNLEKAIMQGSKEWGKDVKKMAKESEDSARRIEKAFKANQQAALRAQRDIKKTMNTKSMGFSDLLDGIFNIRNALMIVAGSQFFGDIIDKTNQIQGIRSTFSALTNSAEQSASEMDWIMKKADQFGQVSLDTAKSYSKFFAASNDKFDTQTMHDIYESMMTASQVLHLQPYQFNLVSLAIEQMASKGKISTEELRRQLGEHLPGAMHLAAKAMGVTEAKLNEMLKNGEIYAKDFLPKFAQAIKEKYVGGLALAQKSTQSAINRMTNAWNELVIMFADSGFIEALGKLVSKIMGLFKSPLAVATVKSLAVLTNVLASNIELVVAGLTLMFATKIITGLNTLKSSLLGVNAQLAFMSLNYKRLKAGAGMLAPEMLGLAGGGKALGKFNIKTFFPNIMNALKLGAMILPGWLKLLILLPIIASIFGWLYKHSVGLQAIWHIFEYSWKRITDKIKEAWMGIKKLSKDATSPFIPWLRDLDEFGIKLEQWAMQMRGDKSNMFDVAKNMGVDPSQAIDALYKYRRGELTQKPPEMNVNINNTIQGTSDPVQTGKITADATTHSIRHKILPDMQLYNLDQSGGY